MRSFAAVSIRQCVIALLIVLGVLVVTGSDRVVAETDIEARLCGSGTGSSVTITKPLTGDTITILPVTLWGTVTNASQIDVTIDGVYDSTIPIGANQTDFTFDLGLPQGTHAIHFEANDRCHQENGTADLTLTYKPGTTTPDGGSTTGPGGETTDEGTNTSGIGSGVQVGPQPDSQPSDGTSGNKNPIAVIVEPIHAVAAALDIDSTLKDGAAQGTLRVTLIVSGAFMASVGSTSCVSVLQFFRQATHAARVRKYFSVRRFVRESAFRFSGLALFVLAFLI